MTVLEYHFIINIKVTIKYRVGIQIKHELQQFFQFYHKYFHIFQLYINYTPFFKFSMHLIFLSICDVLSFLR